MWAIMPRRERKVCDVRQVDQPLGPTSLEERFEYGDFIVSEVGKDPTKLALLKSKLTGLMRISHYSGCPTACLAVLFRICWHAVCVR